MNDAVIKKAADNIRILSAAMVEKAKSGHPGGAMGGADFMAVLFSEFLQFDPTEMAWPNRDRFFLDPGHMSPMLYSTLSLFGLYSMDELANFRQWGSPTPGHPELDIARGVENTSGPLGQGHAIALGAAIAERFLAARFGEWTSHKTYAYISDGGVQEEISQGVGRLAGHLGMHNLVMFYDSNDIQLSTPTCDVTSEDTEAKYKAWGWRVYSIDGHDIGQIRDALTKARAEKEKPVLIIGRTIMGKGAVTDGNESYEGQTSTHGMPLSKAGASFANTVKNLGGDSENPFQIFPEVAEYFGAVKEKNAAAAAEKKQAEKEWASKNPELAQKRASFLAGSLPSIDYAAIEQKPGSSTRKASGVVLAEYAQKVENMLVSSADLCNSDNTDSFLKKSSIVCKSDFSGAFLQSGVSELTMAAVMNGVALHGGVIAVCGTFFVFSDYMKPAVRLASLMGVPVKYVWTHDAFRVGEDGPTHQPIEQETQIRLLERMKNHAGNRSMLALRPADAAETTVAWKMALENSLCPTALLLSRQNVLDVPAFQDGGVRYDEALQAEKGAYVVISPEKKPDIVLVANGSEVSTLVGAAELLQKEGMAVQVVSAISEALFREQAQDYQEEVLPFGIPAFGMTAGLPASLERLVGPLGKVFGLERFGASAPAGVLDEKFGYTPEHAADQIRAYLKEYPAIAKRFATLAS